MAGDPSPHPPLLEFFEWFAENWVLALVIFFICFSVSATYLYFIRKKETSFREPWRNIIFVFSIAATLSVLLAFILNYYIIVNVFYDMIVDGNNDPNDLTPNWGDVLSATLMAPVTEEPAKLLAVVIFYYLTVKVPYFRERFQGITRAKQGIVLGIAAGLGFATNENVLYVLRVYYLFDDIGYGNYGILGATSTFIVRSFSSSLLHASATGFSGYGFVKYKLEGDRASFIRMFGFSMLLHGVYNFSASVHPMLGFSVVLVLSVFMISYLAEQIYHEEVKANEYVPPKVNISEAYKFKMTVPEFRGPFGEGREEKKADHPFTKDDKKKSEQKYRPMNMNSNICPQCKKFMGRLNYCVFCGYGKS